MAAARRQKRAKVKAAEMAAHEAHLRQLDQAAFQAHLDRAAAHQDTVARRRMANVVRKHVRSERAMSRRHKKAAEMHNFVAAVNANFDIETVEKVLDDEDRGDEYREQRSKCVFIFFCDCGWLLCFVFFFSWFVRCAFGSDFQATEWGSS